MAEGAEARAEPLVLNVNDNEGLRYMLTLILERAGFAVIEATSGGSALEKIERRKPDLVLLDVKLPDLDGLEVCRRIRGNPATASTKILHTSATYIRANDKVLSLDGGSDGYLPQPFEPEELVATIRTLLRQGDTEAGLRRDAAQLRDADRKKNEFLSMLAHELRNPLAAIAAALPLVARRPPSDDVERRARDVLQRQTAHLGRLIDDLLDVARVTQGKVELRWEVIDVVDLVDRVAQAALDTKIRSREQSLAIQLPKEPIFVRADVTRLEQIFANLLDNASKYTDRGGHIRVAMTEIEDAGHGAVRVVIRDDGIGIPADVLPEIFALFSQADVPLARSRGGLGIGLTIVRSLVELFGGKVSARSEGLGEGSELEVVLPMLGEVEEAASSSSEGTSRLDPPTKKQRVLLVEDNIDARQMLADLMTIWGHEVSCAADGVSGVAKAVLLKPDFIIVDIGLPGIDGYEVAQRIRAAWNGDPLTLIALTGYGSPEQQAKSIAVGFDLHIVKPVDVGRLEALLAHGIA